MASSGKLVVLITGANSGIGFELAAQLLAKGTYHVLLGSRSTDKGTTAVKTLESRKLPGTIELIPIDVTNDNSIEKAANSVEENHGRLDVLINNAGIAGAETPLRQQMQEAFNVNATGTAVVTEFFAPLLQKSTSTSPPPRIINISSGAGSIDRRLDPKSVMYKINQVQYRASKTAQNMVTACQWAVYGPKIKVFAYCPGFTASNLGPHNTLESGARTAEESVRPLMDVVEGKRDEEAGRFLHKDGDYPW
ncbi:putative short-chain dehydrogenase [Amniculicola lignicola CBS 123094]|uniref:Putative short-chain dehydrogenase n=1 Tax=Amniculicola lignicola CBS 123094 TaxID=1392246 RepID=A0A6A5WJ68_9PLEO|nr:putative short-chain dehydrogenase [Amniculicola lignicola CBS 123094]